MGNGIFLGGSALDQVERKQVVGEAEDREQHDGDQEPGAVLIDVDELLLVVVAAGGFAAAAEQEELQPRLSLRAPIHPPAPIGATLRIAHIGN